MRKPAEVSLLRPKTKRMPGANAPNGANGAVAAEREVARVVVPAGGKIPVKVVDIPVEEESVLVVTLEGTAPLLQNAKTEAYLQEIEGGGGGRKKGISKKEAKDPDYEVRARLRFMKDGSCGHPVEAFTGNEGLLVKALSLVEARKMKLSKDTIKGAVVVESDEIVKTPEGERGFVRIQGEWVPDKHFASVQSGKTRVPIPVHRPKFPKWKMQLRVRFNPHLVSVEQLMTLFVRGGRSYGLGAYRRERGGEFGTFQVTDAYLKNPKANA